ncbi:MAG TPA: SDR family oxidoreductase [Roseiflexaceae bacterium]|nr:SDR family oxidoreductase [Roseiflexaceae bacterium]HMP41196.1 SDR family oxidoreductase [Roseiflexaceae bacterium]
MRLQGKVAIVAGAGWGGIGSATALRFAREGARLVINNYSRAEHLEQTAAAARAAGAEVASVMGDVAESATWESLVATALERYGRLDILVHNAASAVMRRPAELTDEDWERSLAVTLRSPFLSVRHCVPAMIKSSGGSIVFISTVNAVITNPHFGVYSVAKAGLNALTRSVALDHGRDGIRCNAIAPGQIVGEREAQQMLTDPLEDQLSRDCYPLGRYGRPDEIAACALFLASDDASFVTGAVLTADGGLTLQSPEALVRPSFRSRWRDDLLVPRPRTEENT